MQSRYYDPAIGRFINADALISTGQGVLGNNMFAYCNNNPVNAMDPSGHVFVSVSVSFYDDPSLTMFFGGGGGGGCSATVAAAAESLAYFEENPNHSGEAEKHSKEGVWDRTLRILPWDITMLCFDNGLTLFDGTAALYDATDRIALGENAAANLTMIRAFSVEGCAKITAKDGVKVSAMASILSASFSFEFFNAELSFTGYLGGIGAEAGFGANGFTVGFASGVGGSISLQIT